MSLRVLALIENNIGTKLLLSTRLQTLGYQVTILSAPVAFREQVEADCFDWIILDEAAVPPGRRRFLEHLRRHRKEARLVWCGKALRRSDVAIAATFGKPLRYEEIARFFSGWASPGSVGATHYEDAISSNPATRAKVPSHLAERRRKAAAHIRGATGTAEGGEKQ
jgi:hypothetical protein